MAVTGIDPSKNPFSETDEIILGRWLQGRVEAWMADSVFGLHASNVSLSYAHMHGLDVEGVGANSAAVTRSGDQGTIAELRIPIAQSLVAKVHNVVVGPELVWTPVASNTDYASKAKTVVARNALQYYWTDKHFGPLAKKAREASSRYGESFLHVFWDTDAGEDAVPDGDSMVKSGDITAKHVMTWDCCRDPSYRSFDEQPFSLHREFFNKFDVAASLTLGDGPEAEADLARKRQACLNSQMTYSYWQPMQIGYQDTDLIPVWFLYHRITGSVPQGCQGRFLPDGTMLDLQALDPAYRKVKALHRISAGEYEGTPFPWSKVFGILGAQQASDALRRDQLTNATAVSSNLIAVVEGSDQGIIQSAGGGPSTIPVPAPMSENMPKVLDLHGLNPEAYKLDERLQNLMTQVMGADALIAGTETGVNLSGAAMAVLTSTTVQNNSQDQAVWADFVAEIGTAVFRIIEAKMPEARQVALAGSARGSLVTTTELSAKAVSGYERVQVTVGGALQQTEAGKLTFAEMMLKGDGKTSWVQTAQQLQTLLDTGRSDGLTEDLSNELLLISAENEAMVKGEQVTAVLSDNHQLHLKLHKAVVASVTARQDPKVIDAQQAHEMEHINILRTTDPTVLQALGQTPLPPPAPPGMPGQPPGATQPPQPGATHGSTPPGPGAPTGTPPPPPGEATQTKTVLPAINPVTHQRAAPAAGTIPPSSAVRPS